MDFLDVTFNLTNNTYQPYMKPGNTTLYVYKYSNHPPGIIKNIPESINKRLNNISSSKEVFDKAAPNYQQALDNSGYKYKLKYKEGENIPKRKRSRNKKITWYNPPYNANISTNIGKQFLKIIDTCFPKEDPLHKIFNRHTIKVSY